MFDYLKSLSVKLSHRIKILFLLDEIDLERTMYLTGNENIFGDIF